MLDASIIFFQRRDLNYRKILFTTVFKKEDALSKRGKISNFMKHVILMRAKECHDDIFQHR